MKFSILVISLCLITYVTIDSSVAQSQENTSYNATITRDIWGVPHIHGDRDRDAAFGLAYAHAEDDIKNIAENILKIGKDMGVNIFNICGEYDLLETGLIIKNSNVKNIYAIYGDNEDTPKPMIIPPRVAVIGVKFTIFI